jgi:uncharacterized membrane protein
MQKTIAAGQFEAGVIAGITALANELAVHFPAPDKTMNELPNDIATI